jgi:hypothetical protein
LHRNQFSSLLIQVAFSAISAITASRFKLLRLDLRESGVRFNKTLV